MEIKIGIQHVARELSIHTDTPVEQLITQLKADEMLVIKDPKGRQIVVPCDKVAYLDLAAEHARPVGFGTV